MFECIQEVFEVIKDWFVYLTDTNLPVGEDFVEMSFFAKIWRIITIINLYFKLILRLVGYLVVIEVFLYPVLQLSLFVGKWGFTALGQIAGWEWLTNCVDICCTFTDKYLPYAFHAFPQGFNFWYVVGFIFLLIISMRLLYLVIWLIEDYENNWITTIKRLIAVGIGWKLLCICINPILFNTVITFCKIWTIPIAFILFLIWCPFVEETPTPDAIIRDPLTGKELELFKTK